MTDEKLKPIHPGEVLLEEFLKPMALSQNQIAIALRVPARRINEIVQGKRRITADTALRLARYFDMSARFWLGLQMDYDLDIAEDAKGEQLDKEVAVLVDERGQTNSSNALEETDYLTRSPNNLQRLVKSVADLESGKGFERKLAE